MKSSPILSHALSLSVAICILAASSQPLSATGPQPLARPDCQLRVQVIFDDGFPNTFHVRNLSKQGWSIETLSIDLARSFGDAVFDLSHGTLGKDAPDTFYAIRFDGDSVRLSEQRPVTATRHALIVRFDVFPPNEEVAIEIDLDDTSPVSSRGQGRVTFGELAYSSIGARIKGDKAYPAHIEAMFNQTGVADSGAGICG